MLDRVEVRYASGGNENAAVAAVGAPLTVTNSTVRDSLTNGVRFVGSDTNPAGVTAVLTDSTLYGNADAAVLINARVVPTIRRLMFTDGQGRDNRINGVSVRSGGAASLLPGSTRDWNSPDVPFYLDNGFVDVAAGTTLNIHAGQVVKGGLFFVGGTLRALGTTAAPVIHTVIQDDVLNDTNGDGTATTPQPGGSSGGIILNPGGVGVLDHFESRYLGSGGGTRQVVVNAATLTITDSVFRDHAEPVLRRRPRPVHDCRPDWVGQRRPELLPLRGQPAYPVPRPGRLANGRADLAVGSGPGQPSLVKVYRGVTLSGTAEPAADVLDPFGGPTLSGVFVG